MKFDAEDERILNMSRPELEIELAKSGETFDGAVSRTDAAIQRGKAEAEMRLAIRAWLNAPAGKRPSPAALGQRIAEIASAATAGPLSKGEDFRSWWSRGLSRS